MEQVWRRSLSSALEITLVAHLYRRQPVRDHQAGPSQSRSIQRLLHNLNELERLAVLRLKSTVSTFSLSVSRALVASSSSRIFGSLTIARAMAMRCFWPPDSSPPLAPILVLYRWKAMPRIPNLWRSMGKYSLDKIEILGEDEPLAGWR